MGLFDFFVRNSNEKKKDQIAIEINLHCGVLEQCDICGDIVDKQRDQLLPCSDSEAHHAFDLQDERLTIFNGNREDLLQRIRKVREPLPYSCTCENS